MGVDNMLVNTLYCLLYYCTYFYFIWCHTKYLCGCRHIYMFIILNISVFVQ